MSHLTPALSERNETPLERSDRHLGELMQEVRVAQTGVQVLFGFLLTVPFTSRFGVLTRGDRLLYFARWRWPALQLCSSSHRARTIASCFAAATRSTSSRWRTATPSPA